MNERGTWLEVEVGEDSSVHWMGIPPRGFRSGFEQSLAGLGIVVEQEEQTHE